MSTAKVRHVVTVHEEADSGFWVASLTLPGALGTGNSIAEALESMAEAVATIEASPVSAGSESPPCPRCERLEDDLR